MLKCQHIPIPSVKATYTNEEGEEVALTALERKTQEYFEALREHYCQIHWGEFDATKEQVAHFLGIEEDPSLDPIVHAKPLNLARTEALVAYIEVREAQEPEFYSNSDGVACLPVNRSLVFLQRGAGFGEMALLSDTVKRMTTCRADTHCCLGTLNRKNFSAILRRAQIRKISRQISILKQFALFATLSSLKMQKVFYLLEERKLIRGSKVFTQGEKVKGCYLITAGQILYKRKMEVPALGPQASRDSQWLNSVNLVPDPGKRVETRQVAVFSESEVIGFEEMLRCILQAKWRS